MNANVIKEYLVSLGFQLNHPEWDQFQQTLNRAGLEVRRAAGGMSHDLGLAAGVMGGALASIVAGTAALMENVSQADLGYQVFARRMFMSTDAAKQLKIAQDALGYSLEDIIWGPKELGERYRQLVKDQQAMQAGLGGEDFEKQMRKLRDLKFEVTRFKVEMQYLAMGLTRQLSRALFGDDDAILNKFKSFNDWIIANLPKIAQKISQHLLPVLKDILAIGRDLWGMTKDVLAVFIELTGIVAGDDKLKNGKVSIENLASATERWVHALRNVMNTIKEIWDGPAGPTIVGAIIGGRIAGLPGAVVGGAAGLGYSMGSSPKPSFSMDRGLIAKEVEAAAKRYEIDPSILMGLIDKESGWNPTATNKESGAYGLMQIMPKNFHMYGEDATNPKDNIDIGAHLLSDYLKKNHGDIRGALKNYGGFVTKDPSAYQDYILKHAENYRRMTTSPGPVSYQGGDTHIGGITVHVSQPNATAHEIASAVGQELDRKMGKQTQRNLAQFQEVYS